jgi:DNA-binding NarL/FixJ family response regulator
MSAALTPQRRALVVDDDAMVGVLLDNLVESFGFSTKRARSVSEAKRILTTFDPDLAIVDIDLGHGPSGLDFARILAKSHPHVAIMFLSRFSEQDIQFSSLAGLPRDVGYLSKLELYDTHIVQDTIERCLRPSLATKSVRQARARSGGLTTTQYDILVDIAAGLSPQAIATDRGRSLRAIELTLARIQDRHPEIVLDSKRVRAESARAYLEGLPT